MVESTQSERLLLAALRRHARDGEVILPGVRFTDPAGGDVEADIIVLLPDAGAAVIEVKGGQVTFSDGSWELRHRRGRRRIHPTRQARQARHALRRYLDRQPEWDHGLLRSAWLVAFPHTDVSGDMGPEARRDLIIDRRDVPHAMDRVREALANPLDRDPLPPGDWSADVVSLLLRAPRGADRGHGDARRRRIWAWGISVAVLALVGSALAWAVIIGGGRWPPWDPGSAPAAPSVTTDSPGACAPGYQPCLPVVDDLDCADVGRQVRVTGRDEYGLDRDGDGRGCTAYPP